MNSIDWLTPSVVLLLGAVVGLIIALRSGAEPRKADPAAASKREDLIREKDRLLRAIREHQDTADFRGQGDADLVLLALEERAARVLQQLSEAAASPQDEGSELPAASESSGGEGVPSARSSSPSSANLVLKFVIPGMFAALLVFALIRGTSERTGDMQITGAEPEVSTIAKQAPMPSPGEPGGAIPGVPPSLKPKTSLRVDRARARVSVEKESPIAWAELGYALLDAEGWIDAFQTAQSLRELAPQNADARVIEAMVRVPMGQPEAASQLLNEALTLDPKHVMALTARGMIRYSSKDLAGAKQDWSLARSLAGPGQGHDELLAMADGSSPEVPGGEVAAPDSGGNPQDVTGTVRLAEGEQPPAGGVLFIYARRPGQTSGPPAAVKRISDPKLPLTFRLGPADQMIKGMPFPDHLDVSARWDLDGNAMTKGPSDPQASANGIATGTAGLDLVLARP